MVEGRARVVALVGAKLLGAKTGLPLADLLDAALRLFGTAGLTTLRQTARRVEEALGRELGAIDGEWLDAAVEPLLDRHGPTLRRVVDLNLDGNAIAGEIMTDGAALLRALSDDEQARVRTLLAHTYAAFVRERDVLERLLPDALAALLEMRGELAGLPQRVIDALTELRTRLLLHDGRRLLDGPPGQDYWLLRPDYAVVPFHPAREPEVEKLIDWCGDERRRAVRLVHERGGAGKTRLAMEVARRLGAQGWRAGFLDRTASGAPAEALQRLCDGEEPLLVIVDYAETRREELVPLLRHARRGRAPRLRVLLLARAAAEWWESLPQADADVRELVGAYGDAYPLPLLTDEVGARRALFDAAARRFQEKLGLDEPMAAAPDLGPVQFATPLFVHLAALAAVRGLTVEGADDLLDEVLRRERRAWNQGLEAIPLATDEYAPLVAQAVALATLAGGASDTDGVATLVGRAPLAEDQLKTRRRAVAGLVARLYPEPDGRGALGPDLLGEQLVAQELGRHAGLLEATFGDAASAEQRSHALTVLGRIAIRTPPHGDLFDRAVTGFPDQTAHAAIEIGLELGAPLIDRLDQTIRTADEPTGLRLARALERRLPYPTTVARSLAVTVLNLVVENRRKQPPDGTGAVRSDLARALNNLGISQAALGHRELALGATQEAVDLYRKLADDRPDTFLPDLARALNNLGVRLSALHRCEPALDATQEAVDHYRKLAADRPDDFLPYLAAALSSLGIRLDILGRGEPALAAMQEAVDHYKAVAADRPDALLAELAHALNNLGFNLLAHGYPKPARAASAEAVDYYRKLATERPDAFLPDLARSLGTFGLALRGDKREADARGAFEEGVRLVGPAFFRLPQAFAPLMGWLARDYVQACEACGAEPDAALLAPIQAELGKLDEGTGAT